MRKTVEVVTAIEKANFFLANTQDEMSAERKGVASFLETLLMQAGAYAGFRYLESAGITRNEQGYAASIDDETRVEYIVSRKLKG